MTHNAAVRVGNRRLTLTNLDKVLYPETGTTKAEVLQYFTEVGPVLLPLLAGRALTRKRWPDGTAAEPFFQKNVEAATPDWVPRHTLTQGRRTVDYPEVTELAALVYFAQSGALEFHVPQWRFAPDGSPADPDRLVIDLDPGPGVTLDECASVAVRVRERLRARGLDALPVTSGSKGIHLYAGVPPGWTSRRCSEVAKEIARELERQTPDSVTATMTRSQRTGKVFVDWSQNSASKTTISPYSLRGTARPYAAAPRTWDELEQPGLAQLEFREVLARVRATVAPAVVPKPAPAEGRSATHVPTPSPMLATATTADEFARRADPAVWAFEYKLDGIRALVHFASDADSGTSSVRLVSRNGNDLTATYPELLQIPAGLHGHSGVLDGEIVAYGADGAPSFARLQRRMGRSRPRDVAAVTEAYPVALQVFDILELDGTTLAGKSYRDRRTVLDAIRFEEDGPWRPTEPAPDDFTAALEASAERHMEGLVAKRRDSAYRSGRSSNWLKIKHFRSCEVVIGGWQPGEGGRARGIGSLLLGIPDGVGGLRYVGKVGSGLTGAILAELEEAAAALATDEAPFGAIPAPDARSAHWMRPELVAEVRFSEVTGDGRLRHPVWRGLRPDKSVADVDGLS
ncbi:non-homologous end-joining DNA ligase [Rhodococcus sp. NPDC003348]